MRTVLDPASTAKEVEAAVAVVVKTNAVVDLSQLQWRPLSLPELASGLHIQPAVLVPGHTAAVSHRLVGSAMDVAALVLHMSALLLCLGEHVDLARDTIRIVSLADGLSTPLWAALVLLRAGTIKRVAYLGYDRSPEAASASKACLDSSTADLAPGTVAYRYLTRDIGTLPREEYYADVEAHLGGKPHLLFGSPPCSDSSRLKRLREGVFGPDGRLFFHVQRLVEATHRLAGRPAGGE